MNRLEKDQEFPSTHTKFEMPVRQPGRDIEQAVRSASSKRGPGLRDKFKSHLHYETGKNH